MTFYDVTIHDFTYLGDHGNGLPTRREQKKGKIKTGEKKH